MKILYPRITSTTRSALITDAYSNVSDTNISKGQTRAANKVLNFQRDYGKYLWGEDSDNIDLTSPTSLQQIVSLVKPILLKSTRQSGVTLDLSNLSPAQIKKLDTLMKMYSDVAAQSSMFLYQHSVVDVDNKIAIPASKKTNNNTLSSDTEMWNALIYSNVVSRQYKNKVIELSNKLSKKGFYELEESEDSKEEKEEKHYIYLKLYPRNVQFTAPLHNASVAPLSHSRLMRVHRGKKNPTLAISQVLAFNTYDTQWLDLYTSFFDLWFDFGNPAIDVIIGDYIFKDMLLMSPPRFTNSQKEVETFNVQLTSENTNLSDVVR